MKFGAVSEHSERCYKNEIWDTGLTGLHKKIQKIKTSHMGS